MTTSHSNQGRTVDHVFIAESVESFAAGCKEQMYVSTSRGRKSARIYTNNVVELREVIQETSAKVPATELFQPNKQHELYRKQQQAAIRDQIERPKVKELACEL